MSQVLPEAFCLYTSARWSLHIEISFSRSESLFGSKSLGDSVSTVIEPLVDLSALQVQEDGQLSDLLRNPVRIELELSFKKFFLLFGDSVLAQAWDPAFARFSDFTMANGARGLYHADGRGQHKRFKLAWFIHGLGTRSDLISCTYTFNVIVWSGLSIVCLDVKFLMGLHWWHLNEEVIDVELSRLSGLLIDKGCFHDLVFDVDLALR